MGNPKGDGHIRDGQIHDMVTELIEKDIKNIQKARKSKLLVLVSHHSIDGSVTFALNNMLRKVGHVENLDVLLESGGGDLDSAYKILLLLKSYAKTVTVIVPFYAKSAATLIALGADHLQMCLAGELGPLDPQIWDPNSDEMVPALSIKKMVGFITGVHNPIMEVSLADKLSPLLIGAYKVAEETSKQYLYEIFTSKGHDDDKTRMLISVFTEKFLSHGYPITKNLLEKYGIPVEKLDMRDENSFADLHAKLVMYCESVYATRPDHKGQMLILQTDDMAFLKVGNTVITASAVLSLSAILDDSLTPKIPNQPG